MTKEERLKQLEEATKPITEKATKEARKHGSTKRHAPSANDEIDDCEDNLIPPPMPRPEMLYGLAGQIGTEAARGTDINPIPAALSFLTYLSANVGRDTFFLFGEEVHHARLFALHIGGTGQGRKGTSRKLAERIIKRVGDLDSKLLCQVHTGGLSTREGFGKLLHDGHGEVSPIPDKRLLIIDPEFAATFKKSKQADNPLGQAICNFYDGIDLKPLALSNKTGITDPHIALYGNITDFAFKQNLSLTEATDGFGNRFLMIWAQKTGSVSRPKTTDEGLIDSFAQEALEVIRFAKANYPDSKNGQQMHFSDGAWQSWDACYSRLDSSIGNPFIDGLLQRRHMHLLRLSMLLALTDKTRVIESKHLRAALAWVDYHTESVRYIFRDRLVSAEYAETKSNQEKILAFLRTKSGGASMRELNNDCFQKNKKSEAISRALDGLLSIGEIDCVEKKPTTGRPSKIYTLKTSTDKRTNYESPVIAGFDHQNTITDKVRTNSENDGQKVLSPYFVRNEKNSAKPDVARPDEFVRLSVPDTDIIEITT